jgi:hypothetical protein
MQPNAPPPAWEAPQVTALGRALALSVLGIGPLLLLVAMAIALPLSGLSLLGFWYRFQEGGWGMWLILPAIPIGLALLLTVGILQLFRPRVKLWPLWLVPTLACVAGFVFERLGVNRAADVVLRPGIADGQRLRIFATGASEVINTRLFGMLTAGLLLSLAASVVAGRALLGAERVAWSSAAARALGVGAGLTLACLGYALVGDPPSRAPVVLSAFGAGSATLIYTLIGLTTAPAEGGARPAAPVSVWLSAAALVSGLWCFAGLPEAFAQSQLFDAIGGEAVADELAAERAAEALRVEDWAKATLPWLALLPGLIAGFTVPPRAPWRAHLPAQELRMVAWLLALGVGAVGVGRYATGASLERCLTFASAIIPAPFDPPVASGGKPERFGRLNPHVVWVGADSLVVQPDDAPEVHEQTSKLLDPACRLRLGPARGYSSRMTLFVDASLTARHMECLLPALFDLKPEHEGAWSNAPADSLLRPEWGLLWHSEARLPPKYDSLLRRAVWFEFGMAARRAAIHLELQDAYWDLQRGESRLRFSGDLTRRVTLLREALEGQAADVSIASAPHVPAPFVLNAALAVSDAKCQPQLWVRGYSLLSAPPARPNGHTLSPSGTGF